MAGPTCIVLALLFIRLCSALYHHFASVFFPAAQYHNHFPILGAKQSESPTCCILMSSDRTSDTSPPEEERSDQDGTALWAMVSLAKQGRRLFWFKLSEMI